MRLESTLIAMFVLIVYAVVGGVVFHFIEKDNEAAIREDVTQRLAVFLGTLTHSTVLCRWRTQHICVLKIKRLWRWSLQKSTALKTLFYY